MSDFKLTQTKMSRLKKSKKSLRIESDSDESVISKASSENAERCPICLCTFKDQDVGNPDSCDHLFCLECLEEWSKVCIWFF